MRRHAPHESRRRSVVKALSWRVVATLTTVALVLIFTGEIHLALAVGGVEVVAKMAIYYLHERVWSGVEWGWKGGASPGGPGEG